MGLGGREGGVGDWGEWEKENRKSREISLCAGRRIRRSECGRENRPAPFEMTVVGWGAHGGGLLRSK